MASKRKTYSNSGVVEKKKMVDEVAKKEMFSPITFADELRKKIMECYKERKDFQNEKVSFSSTPFPHWRIKDFLSDKSLLKKLKKDLLKLKFKNKYTDLFKFSQSEDINGINTPSISTFRDALFTEFREWLENILGTKLSETVDMSCAKYEYTDFLLCHDDKVEDRQIAFIYYLVPENWNVDDGGRLDLYNTGDDGHPSDICKSLTPSNNCLVFFEVNDTSYHQVSEVLSRSKTRLSLSGWFHSLTDPKFQNIEFTENIQKAKPIDLEQEILIEWINPKYLQPVIAQDIQKDFEESSEIQLDEFLKPEVYETLREEIKAKNLKWSVKGPVNKRCFWYLEEESVKGSAVISNFLKLVRSRPFFKLLRVLTDLDLALLDDENEASFEEEPSCTVETRQWKHGCFSILDDTQFKGEACLDCIFSIDGEDWDFESVNRGYISYVAGEEAEELVTVVPIPNCLTLVYRDESTTRFVKYFDDELCGSETNKCFYDFDMIYFEGKKK